MSTIDDPVVPSVRASADKCGEAWSILVQHTSGRTALLQGSAGFVEGALDGRTVQAVGARRVVLTHWDDFFRGLDAPLRALP